MEYLILILARIGVFLLACLLGALLFLLPFWWEVRANRKIH